MAIYRRGKTYWARAQRDGTEFRESLRTRDRRIAADRHRQWLEKLDALAWGGRPRVALQQAVRSFILEHLPTLKPQAARRYGVSLKWLAKHMGDKYLDQISRAELSEFESWRRTMNASAPTIRRDLACLSSVLTHARIRSGWGRGEIRSAAS